MCYLWITNLEGQKPEPFKDAVSASNGLVWYGLANATDIWQPVDAGYGKILKSLIKQHSFEWLDDDDDNRDCWYENSVFTSSEKRILITKWVGMAYREPCKPKYDRLD